MSRRQCNLGPQEKLPDNLGSLGPKEGVLLVRVMTEPALWHKGLNYRLHQLETRLLHI